MGGFLSLFGRSSLGDVDGLLRQAASSPLSHEWVFCVGRWWTEGARVLGQRSVGLESLRPQANHRPGPHLDAEGLHVAEVGTEQHTA